MNKYLPGLLLLLFLCFIKPVFCQDKNLFNPETLQGGVSENIYLPKELYGSWTVTAILQYTSHAHLFNYRTVDIWELKQVNDKVILTNPITGASATITIDKVVDNTASFSRISKAGSRYITEKPTITVNNDKFVGTSNFIIELYSAGGIKSVSEAFYNLVGKKISGPTLQIFDSIPSQ